MSAYNQIGNLAWITGKCKDVKDAYDIYQITQSEDALLNVAAKVGELVGIGIPLWYADKVLTKTGLDRVFDSLKANKNFEQYLLDQRATTNIRGLCLGTLAEWGLHEFSEWLSKSGLLDPLFESIPDLFTAAQRWVQPRRDPLTLDLDGDGIETVAVSATSPVMFDHDGDGVKSGTGWISGDDGFLVLDRNNNGSIDNGAELFGDSTPLSAGGLASDGFAALADQDTNQDGKVDTLDANWNALRVWRDLNQDGISQAGELSTLTSVGIAGFNTGKTKHSQVPFGKNMTCIKNSLEQQYVKYVTVLSLCLLCLISFLFVKDVCAADQELQTYLDFSLTNYEQERQKVFNLLKIPIEKREYYKIYLSTFDLNDDGNPEIFSYIDGVGFCGNQLGCYIDIYSDKNDKLIKLIKLGIPTFFKFNVNDNMNQKYICISNNKKGDWHNLIIQGDREMYFCGKFYSHDCGK